MNQRSQPLRGVILDWGGVLTGPLIDTVRAWLDSEQIDPRSYAEAMRPWVRRAYGDDDGGECPVHALERGELPEAEFERLLAGLLVTVAGEPVPAAGLLRRMFGASALAQEMLGLVKELREAGLRTALLSNSWGLLDAYPRHLFGELFDDVVISAEVGMRKPEERIFRLAAGRLGLDPAECAFVDDIEGNIAAARAVGFVTIHHREPAMTAQELSRLVGRSFTVPPGDGILVAPSDGAIVPPGDGDNGG